MRNILAGVLLVFVLLAGFWVFLGSCSREPFIPQGTACYDLLMAFGLHK